MFIPIKVINNSNYYNVKVIPDKVMIVVMVPLSIYTKVNEQNFKATVDLNLWRKNKLTQLPVKIIKEVPFVRFRMVLPNQTDILIKN